MIPNLFLWIFRIFERAFYLLVLVLATIFLYVTAFFFNRKSKIYHGLYRWWSRVFVRIFGIKYKIQFEENALPEQYILISNHPSGVDVVLIPGLFEGIPVSKYEVRLWPLIGKIAETGGVLFVKREKAGSRSKVLLDSIRVLESGKSLIIFPEGGCFGRRINPFYDGAFEIAMRTGVFLVPVYLKYNEDLLFEWKDESVGEYLKKIFFHNKRVVAEIRVLKSIDPGIFKTAADFKTEVHNLYKHLENY